MFAAIAQRYDTLNHLLSLNLDRLWRRRAVAALRLGASARALDVCCGTGDLALLLRRRAASVVAVDFCHEMLALARIKAGAEIALVEADALSLPFPDASFAAVTIAFGLRNLDDTAQGIVSLARVLAPGGRLAILEFSTPRFGPARRLHRAYMQALLPRLGSWFSGRSGPYEYLAASVLAFLPSERVVELLGAAGLEVEALRPLALGAVTLYVARKPTLRLASPG